jgi:hypothetical protein
MNKGSPPLTVLLAREEEVGEGGGGGDDKKERKLKAYPIHNIFKQTNKRDTSSQQLQT